jgi:hypothetical protein
MILTTWIAVTLALIWTQSAEANLIAVEPFDLGERSLVEGAGSGVGWGGDWVAVSNGGLRMAANSTSLQYPETAVITARGSRVDHDSDAFHVSAFGAVGDGITDDGPAIEQAIASALASSIERPTVLFDRKTYFIGERMDRWPYFVIKGVDGLVIDGRGAELLFSLTQTPFRIEDSQNVTIRNMTVDYVTPTYTQGSVVQVNADSRTFDVRVDEGYPSPPTGISMLGGGGQHGLVFEPERYHRKVSCGSHFKVDLITQIADGVYRFKPNEQYPRMLNIEVGDRVTHGGLFLALPDEYRTNQRYAQGRMFAFQVERSAEILLEDVDLYATVTMGFNLQANKGDVTFRRVGLRRRPGSDRLLASVSDGIHSRNARGAVIVEESFLEAAGDDLFAVTADEGSIVTVLTSQRLRVRGSDVRVGDELVFFNPGEDLGRRTVLRSDPVQDSSDKIIDLNGQVGDVSPGNTTFLNLDETAKGTTVTNTRFQPVMRQGIQVRRMTEARVENNVVHGFGGDVGIGLGSAFPQDIIVRGNHFESLFTWGIRVGADLSQRAVGDVLIEDNRVFMRDGNAIWIHRGMDGIRLINNEVVIDPASTQDGISIMDSYNIEIDGLKLFDPRQSAEAGIVFRRIPESEVTIRNVEGELADGVPVYLFK